MKRYMLILIGVLLGAVILAAQDDQGNSNDPRTNERANACYEDGTMAYKCDEEWEWVCGWYLIRFEYGLISPEAFPSTCAVLLPSDSIPPAGPPTNTPMPSFTPTSIVTPTFTITSTDTLTPTFTNTPTDTLTPTNTNTPTDTPDPEATPQL